MMFKSFYMSQALALAKRGALSVSPNPAVGCIIIKNGVIVGQGYHKYPGSKHAEIVALEHAKDKAKDATVYVTLEPCCHYGRTGPCVKSLIDSKVKKVIIANLDPNPIVQGKSLAILQEAGIETEVGLLSEQEKEMNYIYHFFYHERLPFVLAKWAMSIDGKMQTSFSDTNALSSLKAKHYTHQMRNQLDAILIGKTTLINDDPLLTVREGNYLCIRQPLRIVLTHNADTLPLKRQLWNTDIASTVIACISISQERYCFFKSKNIEVILIEENKNKQLCLQSLLAVLAEKNITSVMVEGGYNTISQFYQQGLINKFVSYITPYYIGNLNKKSMINIDLVDAIGSDYVILGESKCLAE